MEVSEFLRIYVHLPDILCLNDDFSVGGSEEESFNSVADTDGSPDEKFHGKGSEVLAHGDGDGSIFVTWQAVNFLRNITVIYHRVEIDRDERMAVLLPFNQSVPFGIQEHMLLILSSPMKIKRLQLYQKTERSFH